MNIELLKKEVLHTIVEYIEATTDRKHLNYNYSLKNCIDSGICFYAGKHNFEYLFNCITKYSNKKNHYIALTPYQIVYTKLNENKDISESILISHNKRLEYLGKILQEIIYIEQMKQEGKIYTYYNLIDLFKF